MISEHKDEYVKCSRHQKTALAEKIVQKWRNQSPPGRFIRQDKETERWYDVGNKEARHKVSQTIREGPLKKAAGGKRPAKQEKEVVVEDVPPPPPPPVSEEVLETPPQNRSTKDLGKDLAVASPTSVMGMPFCPVEDEIAEEAGRQIRRSSSRFSNFFEGIGLPGFPRRQRSKRLTSEDTDASDCQPPAKRPHFQNPLASFLGGLVQDKLPKGPKTVTIVQDNAVSIPEPSMLEPAKTEVVFLADEEEPPVAPAAAAQTRPRRAERKSQRWPPALRA